MSRDSRDYYHSASSTAGSRRTNRSQDDRDHGGRRYDEHLPSIREVVGDELNTPVRHAYNTPPRDHAGSENNLRSYLSHPGPTLPPITRHDSSQGTRSGHEYHTRHHTTFDRLPPRIPATPPIHSSPKVHSRNQPASPGTFHVFDSRGNSPAASISITPQGSTRSTAPVGGQLGFEDARKRFECHICGRRMERQSVYNQHMITHTDQRPHICAICGKSFNSKSNLNRHVQTHGARSTQKEPAEGWGSGASSSKEYYGSSRKK